MKEKLVVATGNAHKLREIAQIFTEYEIVSQKQAGFDEEVEETGVTFVENALIKARAASKALGVIALADDSGLCVEALGGAPGVYSARYCGWHGDDKANNEKLLSKLSGVPDEKRTARFVCAICVSFPDGSEITAEGACEGRIGYEYRGNNGFGYDPLFMVGDKSFAELSAEEKDAVSHRGNALKRLEKLLSK